MDTACLGLLATRKMAASSESSSAWASTQPKRRTMGKQEDTSRYNINQYKLMIGTHVNICQIMYHSDCASSNGAI